EPGDDPLGVDSQIVDGLPQRLQRSARIGVAVLPAGKALFLVVADDSQAARRRRFDEGCSGVMKSADAEANEMAGFAARQSCREVLRSLRRERTVGPMNVLVLE